VKIILDFIAVSLFGELLTESDLWVCHHLHRKGQEQAS
jgi:hypothetical protein